jgi:hypothetical protein
VGGKKLVQLRNQPAGAPARITFVIDQKRRRRG